MSKTLPAALLAGLLSSGLFMVVFALGLGFLFLFLPTLPLLTLGLRGQFSTALLASFLASLIIGLAAGPASGVLYLLTLGLPSWHISRQSLRWKVDEGGQPRWFPLGAVFTSLSLAACTLIALMTLFYATQPENLPQLLSQNVQEAFSELRDDYGEVIDMLAGSGSFLIFSTTTWLWGLALYGHAWLVNRALVRKRLQQRPDFALTSFLLPTWMLSLLIIAAFASMAGGESLSFLGKSVLLILLFPYFLLGVSLMHETSKTWPNRGFLLFFIYVAIFAQFWPALILSGVGLWHQIKRLSWAGTSSTS